MRVRLSVIGDGNLEKFFMTITIVWHIRNTNGYTVSNGLVFHSFSIGIILSVTALIVAFEKPTQ